MGIFTVPVVITASTEMMKEQPPISQPESEQPNPNRYVADWEEGARLVDELTGGESAALGSWYRYPETYTILYKDALSGEGSGYYIYRNENGKHVELVANIHVGVRPPERNEEDSHLPGAYSDDDGKR